MSVSLASDKPEYSGVIAVPRKTNYDFERREREKAKAADSARKALAKAEKKAFEQGTSGSAPVIA